MKRRGEASEDKVCYTCGHTGFADFIATCSLCKVSHAHTYCMSLVRFEVPELWRCEECLRSAEAISNRNLPEHQFWHKGNLRKVEAGKVKFITNEEVVTLASGRRSHGRGNPSAFGHHSDFTCFNRPPISCKTVASTFPKSKVIMAPSCPKKGPVYVGVGFSPSKRNEPSKSVVNKEKDSLRADDGQICLVDKHKKNKTPLKPQHVRLFKEEPANASLAMKEGRDLHERKNANVLPINASGTAVRSIPQSSQSLPQKTLLPLKLVISADEKHHHALEACWRGSFEVLKLVNQFHGTVRAHFPCQVSPKVYDISKHLPGILQFKMLSRESVWPKIFKLEPPTKNDVALYFLCQVERHKKNYAHFIQHISSHDYALQGSVADAELLLFTSAQLQIDSKDIGGNIYLWGVFRHLKKKKASHVEEKPLSCSPSTPKASFPQSRSKAPLTVTSMEVAEQVQVEMEIDMLGGHPIGRTDVPVKLEDAPSQFSKPVRRPPVSFATKKSVNSPVSGPPPGFPIPAYQKPIPAPPGKPTKDLASSNSIKN
ncbi:uncharacterized protein LOC110031997 isoform X1 [Phalaenopsis equestris]|uniref:uncharacterized protein LOC110031997 isoform X1 n=2 Tax=Phalaenopsis equestris TaxID=78828 RepID=UPI0009E1F75C|nr:uncharacterized protein LOC110031997 isoform X1 [Phalaenopsis equestris]XP_020591140.1 uncharacterized protein LOC110031997 isoform X1 [Phalaenopsis equestris]